ncbi:phosphotransferase [Candidatus Bathyarchaeota archaeon]|nr:phosphotransferase [Candidatus Bathyarchaeota archaeon]
MPRPSREDIYSSYYSQLTQLSTGLPMSFRPTLTNLIACLPELFADDWPLVPHHTDLLENNIHVDPATGALRGICDWKDTAVGPFGTSLWSLETMLGVRTRRDGWRYHANQQELLDMFWDSFRSAMGSVSEEQMASVEVARLVGLFLENGFVYVDDITKVPISEGSYEMRYLEAVTLGLWARTGH